MKGGLSMPMNPNFLCCIGAELKNSTQQTTRMSQVYLYRAFEDQTLNDMLQPSFFDAAMGIIRKDDLLLLYSPNEASAKYTYARVSNVDRDGVVIERISIEATSISVDTTGYSNLSGNNLQEILNNLDTTITTINDTFVRKDGTSIMSAPLKFIAGSFRGAVGPYLNGVEFYNVGSDGALGSAIARLTSTNGLTPNTDNILDIGSATKRFKDLYIARVITGVINNGYDIAVPATAQPETFALKREVDLAANSGRMITDEGVWFAKMYAASTVPTGAEYDGKNYADFSQVDSDNNPVIKIYTGASGAWTLTETITPPADYDGYVPITSKIWDIIDQTGQQGGRVLWNHQTKTFTPYPTIISFENAALTGNSTVVMPNNPTDNNITNKKYVDDAISAIPAGGSGLNVGDIFCTKRTDNELNGAVECDGATYNTTDFTGDGSIGELLEAGKLDYVSLSAYSTAISTKGWCDKIGWDGAGNTAFRVPTLNAHIVQTNNIPVIGNGMALGVTDGTTNAGLANTAISSDNILKPRSTAYGVNVGDSATGGTQLSAQKGIGVVTDPANSGIIADTSDTAQLRVMIQLATSATDEALETCTSVLADVAALKYDYVVEFQAPTAENDYTWYRKYKSGWVEQGGILRAQTVTAGYASSQTLTLPITMADTNFTVTFGDVSGNTAFQSATISRTTTGGTVSQMNRSGSGSASIQFSYVVSGMAAQ